MLARKFILNFSGTELSIFSEAENPLFNSIINFSAWGVVPASRNVLSAVLVPGELCRRLEMSCRPSSHFSLYRLYHFRREGLEIPHRRHIRPALLAS